MPDFYMRKVSGTMLAAADDEAEQALTRFRLNDPVKVTLKRPRNYEFFKKWWALVNYTYEFWEPAELPADGHERKWMKVVTPAKNLDRFRKDLTILAGYYTATYRINGEVRIEAQSISFGSMDEDTFEKLYSDTIDAALRHVFSHTNMSEELLRETVDELLAFAA